MGQTLEHGIYLPDEGERNCYSGLAANWQLLDGAVGTVAEHTSQIAGKAPAVHTHAKSDITDFPAYGTTAGTICEGNDSRLSDARTPVAHTHTKSDITDLFNSANTWSNNQIIASSNDKCYYVKDTVYELGQDYSNGEHLGGLTIYDKNGATVGLLDIVDRSYGNMEMRIRVQQKFDPNSNNRSTSGNILFNELVLGITPTKTNYIGFNADLWGGNTYNLGTASSKWKTLNGINPGALSLPSGGTTENTDWYNVAGDILPTGGNTTDFTWGQNYFTPAKDGWLAITVKQCSAISVWCDTLKYGMSVAAPDTSLNRQLLIPVVANISYEIRITGNSWFSARLIMPKGNV